MKLGTLLHTWINGRLVGIDHFGNRYYQQKGERGVKARRWVIYKGLAEPSKVPPEWHGWLHHIEGCTPSDAEDHYSWQKPHKPNLTGTSGAYFPPGHVLAGGKRMAATGDYTPWKPE